MKPQAGARTAVEQSAAGDDAAPSGKVVLRLLAFGSKDDGRSTLIARLLHDCRQIANGGPQAAASGNIDFVALVDGLEAEREQGIKLDVARRVFDTARRSFVAADAPAPDQYARNMATGIPASDVGVIIVDAREGITLQTRRHAYVAALLGLRSVALAVDQMDLVDYSADVFERIAADFTQVAAPLGFSATAAIPVSARHGDNVAFRSGRMDWYSGPTLLGYLEAVEIDIAPAGAPFRFIVQSADRAASDVCAFSGTVASGSARVGDSIVVATSGRASHIARLRSANADLQSAAAGDAVTFVLCDALDLARGDVLAPAAARPQVSSQFAATVLWMSDAPLLPGRSYLLRAGAHWVPATITSIKHKIDVASHEHLAARTLEPDEVAFCNLSTANPIAFDPYADNPATGAFILVDRATNEAVGAGLIEFALRRASNIHHEELSVSKPSRAALKHQSPAALWFTGLSGSGKSTIAKIVERKLHARGYHTYMLDGDNLRHGLTKDLGFSQADRVENIRRAGEVAKLFVDAGVIVICSFISPFNAERDMVRRQLDTGEFIEIFVDTPIEECMRRDPKGLYAKAQAGQIKNFTGFDSPYEMPNAPELTLPTTTPAETLADRVLEYMASRGLLK